MYMKNMIHVYREKETQNEAIYLTTCATYTRVGDTGMYMYIHMYMYINIHRTCGKAIIGMALQDIKSVHMIVFSTVWFPAFNNYV